MPSSGALLARVLTLAWVVATDLAMVPSLQVIKANRRHFELFVGCFQLVAGVAYNASNVAGARVFLAAHQW